MQRRGLKAGGLADRAISGAAAMTDEFTPGCKHRACGMSEVCCPRALSVADEIIDALPSSPPRVVGKVGSGDDRRPLSLSYDGCASRIILHPT